MLQRIQQGIRNFISNHVLLASILSIFASILTILAIVFPFNGNTYGSSNVSKPSPGPIFEEDCMKLHAKSITTSTNKIVIEVEGENITSYPSLDYIFYCQLKNKTGQLSDKVKTKEVLYSHNLKQFKITCPSTNKNNKNIIIILTKYLMTTTTSSCYTESSIELFPIKINY